MKYLDDFNIGKTIIFDYTFIYIYNITQRCDYDMDLFADVKYKTYRYIEVLRRVKWFFDSDLYYIAQCMDKATKLYENALR